MRSAEKHSLVGKDHSRIRLLQWAGADDLVLTSEQGQLLQEYDSCFESKDRSSQKLRRSWIDDKLLLDFESCEVHAARTSEKGLGELEEPPPCAMEESIDPHERQREVDRFFASEN